MNATGEELSNLAEKIFNMLNEVHEQVTKELKTFHKERCTNDFPDPDNFCEQRFMQMMMTFIEYKVQKAAGLDPVLVEVTTIDPQLN